MTNTSNLVKFATAYTNVMPTVVCPAELVNKAKWTDAEIAEVVALNHDRLSIYQLSDLETEVAEYNADFDEDISVELYFEQLVISTVENDEVVN